MIVLDASAAVAAVLDAGPARRFVGEDQVHIPHLADAEVANSLRCLVAAGTLAVVDASAALQTWQRLGVTRYPMVGLLGRVWELRDTISAHDATHVALTESLGCALVIADTRLSRAVGPR